MQPNARPFDRLIAFAAQRETPLVVRYLLSTVLIVAVAVIRSLWVTDLLPWLLFVPVILLVSLAFGRGSGLWATMLAAALGGWSVHGHQDHHPLDVELTTATVLFLAVSAVIVELGHELRDAFKRYTHAEKQLSLLNRELGHRLKNALTIFHAIAHQTLRQAGDVNQAISVLDQRMAALGRAAELLTTEAWETADLGTVARAALAPHLGPGIQAAVDGPPVQLSSERTMALSLALHELATNSVKYGALGHEGGRLELVWAVQRSDDPRLLLRWQEHDGPAVAAPSRRGFGSTLIQRALKASFHAEPTISYLPSGLMLMLDAPLSDVAAAA